MESNLSEPNRIESSRIEPNLLEKAFSEFRDTNEIQRDSRLHKAVALTGIGVFSIAWLLPITTRADKLFVLALGLIGIVTVIYVIFNFLEDFLESVSKQEFLLWSKTVESNQKSNQIFDSFKETTYNVVIKNKDKNRDKNKKHYDPVFSQPSILANAVHSATSVIGNAATSLVVTKIMLASLEKQLRLTQQARTEEKARAFKSKFSSDTDEHQWINSKLFLAFEYRKQLNEGNVEVIPVVLDWVMEVNSHCDIQEAHPKTIMDLFELDATDITGNSDIPENSEIIESRAVVTKKLTG